LKEEIIVKVKSLRLNLARIDALAEQLYDVNRRLISCESRLMRLAASYSVAREDFLLNYNGSELDPDWVVRVSKLPTRGWRSLVAQETKHINGIRSEINALASETGLQIGEIRRIARMVQKGEREASQAKKEMVEANLRLIRLLKSVRSSRCPVNASVRLRRRRSVSSSIRIGAEFFGASSSIDMNDAVKLCGLSLMTAWHFAQRIA
jgi:hypothetical protein